MNVKDHYKNHLSNFYTWIFGDYVEMQIRQKTFFEQNGVTPVGTKIAIDLGSGSGFQSCALAEMGFKVHALDESTELLSELQKRNANIQVHQIDLRSFLVGREIPLN